MVQRHKASQAPAAPPTVQSRQHCPPHGQDQAQGRAKEEEVGHVEVQATQADLGRREPPGRGGLGLVLQHVRVDAAQGREPGRAVSEGAGVRRLSGESPARRLRGGARSQSPPASPES